MNWAVAIMMILVTCWVFYRFIAPKSWREWAGAGLVNAFLIALYAEMYGFPLTIYLTARFFGLDRDNFSANLWSAVFGLGEAPMMIAMLLSLPLLFFGIMLIARGWRQVYLAQKKGELTTTGVYSLVRHPQYTGIFVALFAEGVLHWPTVFSVGIYPFIVIAYTLLARREEKKMVQEFGERYLRYREQVPMFIPQWSDVRRYFHQRSQRRQQESKAGALR